MRKLLKRFWVLFLVLVLVLLGLFILRNRRGAEQSPAPSPSPLSLVRVFPPEGNVQMVVPNLAVSFEFSRRVDLSSASLIINPFINFDLEIKEGGKTLLVKPLDPWEFGQNYSLELSVESLDGQKITIEHSFTPQEVVESDLPGEH